MRARSRKIQCPPCPSRLKRCPPCPSRKRVRSQRRASQSRKRQRRPSQSRKRRLRTSVVTRSQRSQRPIRMQPRIRNTPAGVWSAKKIAATATGIGLGAVAAYGLHRLSRRKKVRVVPPKRQSWTNWFLGRPAGTSNLPAKPTDWMWPVRWASRGKKLYNVVSPSVYAYVGSGRGSPQNVANTASSSAQPVQRVRDLRAKMTDGGVQYKYGTNRWMSPKALKRKYPNINWNMTNARVTEQKFAAMHEPMDAY